MSKAFTKESDEALEQPMLARPVSLPGGKNYVTPGGAQRLRDELERVMESLRAKSGDNSSDAAADRETLLAKQRIAQLQESLGAAEVVSPPPQPWEQVVFGAMVTVRDTAGVESRYRIVGRDETDLDRNWVSWVSPIGRALLKARLGQRVNFRIPAGEQVWEIVGIEYEDGGNTKF